MYIDNDYRLELGMEGWVYIKIGQKLLYETLGATMGQIQICLKNYNQTISTERAFNWFLVFVLLLCTPTVV